MNIVEKSIPGYERVVFGSDESAGYRGIIAIHSTRLGPAVGGTRFWDYRSDDEALTDALRLARGMTYKNALAELPFGGGKSIIIGDNRIGDRETLFRAHGRFVNSLGGRSEEHTSELQSPCNLVCRLLLEKINCFRTHTS